MNPTTILRKAYSIWLCFERPIVGIEEPVIRYKMMPVSDYKYTGGGTITECRNKFDDGDLMETILISVPDLTDYVKENGGIDSFDYMSDKNSALYMLLATDVPLEMRQEFYSETRIITQKEGRDIMQTEDMMVKLNINNLNALEKKNADLENKNAALEEQLADKDAALKDKDAALIASADMITRLLEELKKYKSQ